MMVAPAIYLDECIDRRIASGLQARGIDLMTVMDADTQGLDDETQLIYATQQGRLLVSQNQMDFRRLHLRFMATGRAHAGMILVPQTVPFQRLEHRIRLLVDWVATFAEHQSRLFTWTVLQQQIIHGFRLPEWEEETVRNAIGWSSS